MKVLVFDAWPGQPVTCGSGLGSSLLKLPAYADAAQAGHTVELLTSRAKADLLAGSPLLARRYSDPSGISLQAYDLVVPFGVPVPDALRDLPRLHRDPRTPSELKRDYDLVSHVRFWRDLLAGALGAPPPAGPARLSLRASAAALRWARERLPERRPVVALSLSALTNLKRYPRWAEVARGLAQALPDACLLLVGLEAPGSGFPSDTLDLTCRTTLEQLVALVSLSNVVVGTDGLVTNLGVACGRPTVALFTVIRPDFVIDPALELRAPVEALTHPCCPLQPCYPLLGNYRTAACPFDPTLGPIAPPRCADFDPIRIVSAVAELARAA